MQGQGQLILPSVEELAHVVAGVGCRGDLETKLASCPFTVPSIRRTVFSLLCTEYVWLCVIVVLIEGIGSLVVAMFTLLVGYNGFVFVAVIFFGGTGCMGAYLVGPVCIVYAMSKSPDTGLAASAGLSPAATVLSTFFGPSVPLMSSRPVLSAGTAGQVPVMPE